MSIDKGQGAVMSIKGAWEITKGYGWYIFWKTFVIGLFAVVGIFGRGGIVGVAGFRICGVAVVAASGSGETEFGVGAARGEVAAG